MIGDLIRRLVRRPRVSTSKVGPHCIEDYTALFHGDYPRITETLPI
jgi:hypothetical protein